MLLLRPPPRWPDNVGVLFQEVEAFFVEEKKCNPAPALEAFAEVACRTPLAADTPAATSEATQEKTHIEATPKSIDSLECKSMAAVPTLKLPYFRPQKALEAPKKRGSRSHLAAQLRITSHIRTIPKVKS